MVGYYVGEMDDSGDGELSSCDMDGEDGELCNGGGRKRQREP